MELLKLTLSGRRAQAWGSDLVLAVAIFSIALTAVYFYSINDLRPAEEVVEKLSYEGKKITNSLLSEGHPENWKESDVTQIGLLSDGKINETKLESFYTIATTNYARTKNLFNTNYDYYFFLKENMTINSIEVDGIGKSGVTRDNIDSENLIKITRAVVYKGKVMSAYLYIFEE